MSLPELVANPLKIVEDCFIGSCSRGGSGYDSSWVDTVPNRFLDALNVEGAVNEVRSLVCASL